MPLLSKSQQDFHFSSRENYPKVYTGNKETMIVKTILKKKRKMQEGSAYQFLDLLKSCSNHDCVALVEG